MSSPTVSVVIVNYNHFTYLRQCLQSIRRSDLADFEVIVVDNHSTEDGLGEVEREFPEVHFVHRSENEGFARGNNIGIRLARGQYVVLLNNDAALAGRGWGAIPEYFAGDPQLAVIQPTVLLADGRRINNCGLMVHYLGFAWDNHYGQEPERVSQPETIAAFSGAAAVVRRSALEHVGLFDERYFMYHEDVDLSYRLRLAGYTIRYQPRLTVTHRYTYKRDRQRYFWLERNRLYTLVKNYPLRAWLVLWPAFLFMELGMLYFSAVHGWWLKKVSGYGQLIRDFGRLRRERYRFSPAISTSQFFQPMVGSITFDELDSTLLRRLANPILAGYWRLFKRWL